MDTLRDCTYAHACTGCPAEKTHTFGKLVREGRGACSFRTVNLASRARLPPHVFTANAVGLVRQGILIRTHDDAEGHTYAVDVAGPGALVLGSRLAGDPLGGYAVGALSLCVLPRDGVERALAAADETVGDFMTLSERARSRVERLAEVRARTKTLPRLTALFAMLAETLGDRDEARWHVPKALQQRDLAKLAAVRHETVSRVLATLETRGVLARGGQGEMVLDRARLAAC